MVALAILSTEENTEQTTTSSTFVNAGGSSQTPVLANGVDYFVMYRASVANDISGSIGRGRIVLGPSGTDASTTVLGLCNADSANLNQANTGGQVQGFCRITGNGTDVLKFQIRAATDTTRIGSMSIVAIPLDQLTEGVDYFFSGTNSGTDEVTNAAVRPTYTTQRSATFNLPDDGDYLVLMSSEGRPQGGSSAEAAIFRPSIAGTVPSPDPDVADYQYEWESNADRRNFAVAKIANLSAGSNTFEMLVASRNTAVSDYRRSRIAVFRVASFDQLTGTNVAAGGTEGLSTASSTYVDASDLDTNYTPNQAEDVVILGSWTLVSNSIFDPPQCRIRNATDGINHNGGAGCIQNNASVTSGADNSVVFGVATENLGTTATRTYKAQAREPGGFATVYLGRNRTDGASSEASLILWSMEATPLETDQPAVFFGCNF